MKYSFANENLLTKSIQLKNQLIHFIICIFYSCFLLIEFIVSLLRFVVIFFNGYHRLVFINRKNFISPPQSPFPPPIHITQKQVD